MVRFGPDGRTKTVYQALTWQQFAKVRRGITRDEVRLLLGPPGETMRFDRRNEEVWSYRYQVAASDNRIFNVHLDASTGYVRATSDQIDPLLNPTSFDAATAH
jgi:outer membrane protein assembly factor BamE (lipoprotein component of BamABCDE complex)